MLAVCAELQIMKTKLQISVRQRYEPFNWCENIRRRDIEAHVKRLVALLNERKKHDGVVKQIAMRCWRFP